MSSDSMMTLPSWTSVGTNPFGLMPKYSGVMCSFCRMFRW